VVLQPRSAWRTGRLDFIPWPRSPWRWSWCWPAWPWNLAPGPHRRPSHRWTSRRRPGTRARG